MNTQRMGMGTTSEGRSAPIRFRTCVGLDAAPVWEMPVKTITECELDRFLEQKKARGVRFFGGDAKAEAQWNNT
jgi:hypothetical protein